MGKLRYLTILTLALGAFGTIQADTLEMDGVSAGQASTPSRGMTAASVESRYGTPQSKVAPVGDPPISRWIYSDFVVFFEYDRVIHAVVKRQKTS